MLYTSGGDWRHGADAVAHPTTRAVHTGRLETVHRGGGVGGRRFEDRVTMCVGKKLLFLHVQCHLHSLQNCMIY